MNDQIRKAALELKEMRQFVEWRRQQMREGSFNPRVFESLEMNLQKEEAKFCTLVIETLDSEGQK